MNDPRCRAKNPEKCRFHGTSMALRAEEVAETKSAGEAILRDGSAQQKMFHLFKEINEDLKTELCEQGRVETVEDTSNLKTGFTYECKNCGETHYFTRTDYDQTKGGKALSFMFKQLPTQYRNNQFLVPIQTLQEVALNESFTRHYSDDGKKVSLLQKVRGRLEIASRIKTTFDGIVIPSKDRKDWSPLIEVKEGSSYVEPEKVPKELLYKFSQCLRKVPHNSIESAAKSMVENGSQGKEVYECPHCKKYHYGRTIDPKRTEEERYEFAKKTWAMPVYRDAISLLVETYGLNK